MIIDPRLKRLYPYLARWVTKELPKRVKAKKQVWNAFLKYSELSEAEANRAFCLGNAPTLSFDVMPRANGEFRGSTHPNTVFLAKAICDRFSSDINNRVTMPRMLLLVESTVLHEMVHWGDWKDGKDQAGEEGKAFEKEAYGKDINRYW